MKKPFLEYKDMIQLSQRCNRVDMADLDWADGNDNTAGIGQNIYVAKFSDIETLPDPILNDSTGSGSFADLVTISSNIVMKAAKSFWKIYVTLEKGSLNHESQGEMDGMSFLNKLKFFHPGSKAEVLGFAQWCKNSSLIFIVPELDGAKRILGHNLYPAKMISAPGGTGEKTADLKGTTFEFQSARKGPAPIFTGRVQVSGVGSGADADSDGFQEIFFAD